MYHVSETWNNIIARSGHRFEIRLVIGEGGRLITRDGSVITFGGSAISIGQSGPESGYAERQIMELSVDQLLFPGKSPSAGGCISQELTVTMLRPAGDIPPMALVRPWIRVTDGTDVSEWIPQGVFYIDTREYSRNDDGLNTMRLHCFDAMLMTEQDYPPTALAWPAEDTDVVQEIADFLGIGVDPRTWDIMAEAYTIGLPAGYSMREVLSRIGAMYAGNWVINYDGQLRLVTIDGIPAETNYLTDNSGFVLLFGGDRILV